MNSLRSSLLPAWPFTRSGARLSPWSGLEAEMDRLFAAALGAEGPATFPVDVYADASATHVRAALPGCRREDLRIELVDGQLTLSVVPPAPAAGEAASPSPVEPVPGEAATASPVEPVARRTLAVPEDTAADQVAATYVDGILTVTLPRRPAAAPRRIEIRAA
ncbi:MAG: Hsp20/alpha crystallin family protein [Opitutaceae bacterium]